MKKMGAKHGYSVVHGLIYLPLCFFGIGGLIMSFTAVVAFNPLIVGSILLYLRYKSNEKLLSFLYIDLYRFSYLC